MTPTRCHSPGELFQEAIAAGIRNSVPDCWRDFAHWEHARQFADDPGHPAKAAIEWIISYEELRGGLDEFPGAATDDCRQALDTACTAFAQLDHSVELVTAVRLWLEFRQQEAE